MKGFKLILMILLVCLTGSLSQSTKNSSTSNYTVCAKCACNKEPVFGEQIQINCVEKSLISISQLKLHELRDQKITVTHIHLSQNNLTKVLREDLLPIAESLQTIDLRWNDISSIEDYSFDSTKFLQLYNLQLAHNKIRDLPDNAFKELRPSTLDLSYNDLHSIPNAIGEMSSVGILYLNNNPIGKLDPTPLKKRLGVTTLDLSNCLLEELNMCDFGRQFTESLNELYVDQNNLGTIKKEHYNCPTMEEGLLNGVPYLSALDFLSIRYSGVTEIKKRTFEMLPSLERLHLGGNNFGIFKGQVFAGLNIKELELSHCNITDLKGVLFRDFDVDTLDLSYNNIDVIHKNDFKHFAHKPLTHINLAYSNIQVIKDQPFENLTRLDVLSLANNKLDDNSLSAFSSTGNFYFLDLDNNFFTQIPNMPKDRYPHLDELRMANNRIHEIQTSHLEGMSRLEVLILPENGIRSIENDALSETPLLTNLDLDNAYFTELPPHFQFPKLRTLYLRFGKLRSLPTDLCTLCPLLKLLELQDNELNTLPSFENCTSLQLMVASENNINSLPSNLFLNLLGLGVVDFRDNPIGQFPEGIFETNQNIQYLYLGNTSLTSLPGNFFSSMPHLRKVDLSSNLLTKLEDNLFSQQASFLYDLDLSDNLLKSFTPNILPVNSTMSTLNLSSNHLKDVNFPSGGLHNLVELYLDENEDLLQVPDIAQSPNLTIVFYTYSYHCCIWDDVIRSPPPPVFDPDSNDTVPTEIPVPEEIEFLTIDNFCVDGEIVSEYKELVERTASRHNLIVEYATGCRYRLIDNETNIGTDEERMEDFVSLDLTPPVIIHNMEIKCFPRPDALSPCVNLMDPWPLRVLVWFVWVLALLGNGAVLFVAIAAREKLEVYQFLICCLAFADFCMGAYLAFLAAVDIRTFGDVSFYQSALQWQLGPGCKAAGFIAVFASELSVFTLVILTLERVHTIAFTFNNDDKCKKRVAVVCTLVAVLVSAFLASLPLVDINSYSRVAVCLPYLTDRWTDKLYIALILTINLIAFLVISLSYLYIFRNICKSPAAQRRKKDLTVSAAKIAVLIVTAFICWVPIVVVGYLALGGINIVDTEQAKYLIVLVYPLNACLNPFIYGIFTRQFRQKVSVLCSRKSQSNSLPLSRHHTFRRGSSSFSVTSPRGNPSPLELINLRQSRRSRSFSIHQDAVRKSISPPALSPPLTSPPVGVFMGRRNSLPAAFGSTVHLTQLGLTNVGVSSPDSVVVPPLPFRLGDHYRNTSEPNLGGDEVPETLPNNLSTSLGGSQDSANRHLPDIPEEQESVCSEDFSDAQEEIISEQPLPVLEAESEMSSDSVPQDSSEIKNIRDSMDSAYSGCSTMTPDNLQCDKQLSTSLSRGGNSFSSYDTASSGTECRDSHASDALAVSDIHTDLDQLNLQSSHFSSPHELKAERIKGKDKTQSTNSPTHNCLASIGSETSV